jgi:homoserine O-succinyltransferase
VAGRVDNTWHDTAEGIVGNWIGLVYQLTHEERALPFMEGVDPTHPLDFLRSRQADRSPD